MAPAIPLSTGRPRRLRVQFVDSKPWNEAMHDMLELLCIRIECHLQRMGCRSDAPYASARPMMIFCTSDVPS